MPGSIVRVGVLHDFPPADGGAAFELRLREGMAPVVADGRCDDQVEFVHAVGLGLPLPGGSAYNVQAAFSDLVGQGVVAIVGPAISDNALVVQPLADRERIPCINYTGSDQTRSEYMFQYQIGSLEDEPSFLAAHLAGRGVERVALVRDRSYVGRRMADFFDDASAVAGIRLVGQEQADALVFLGMWDDARRLADTRPTTPVVGNSALMYGYHDPSAAAAWDGWAFPDTVSERNPLYAALGAVGPGVAGQVDLGRLVGEAIARARVATGPGLTEGLERIKSIPATSGEPSTLMGFGRCDRGALKGRYLVVREWKDGRTREFL
jgi:branched-chain amino acid transport system substrate-binding protein